MTNALIESKEERLKLEDSIPRKLQDGWEPTIRIRVNDFDCNALCDLGASSSIMPKSLYDMLDLKPLDESILGVHLIDSTVKRPLGRIDNVLIISNISISSLIFLFWI